MDDGENKVQKIGMFLAFVIAVVVLGMVLINLPFLIMALHGD